MIVITVARKPLGEATVAANVLEHGCGALNIDASRIASDGSHMVQGLVGRVTAPAGDERKGAALGWGQPGQTFTPTNHAGGRWPANLVLQHLEGCKEMGAVKVKSITGGPTSGDNAFGQDSGWNSHENRTMTIARPGNGDGTETITAWDCQPGCPVATLDEQSNCHARGNVTPTKGSTSGMFWGVGRASLGKVDAGDTGGASRFFKQIKPT